MINIPLRRTVEFRYSAVQQNMIIHMLWQLLGQNMHQRLYWQQTPHISPSRAKYGGVKVFHFRTLLSILIRQLYLNDRTHHILHIFWSSQPLRRLIEVRANEVPHVSNISLDHQIDFSHVTRDNQLIPTAWMLHVRRCLFRWCLWVSLFHESMARNCLSNTVFMITPNKISSYAYQALWERWGTIHRCLTLTKV